MGWLAWVVLAVLAAATVVWLVRRFRAEGHRIDEMVRDFDRANPRQEPGSPSPARRLAGLRRRR
jgi:H+/Cl- antiporter ClcA